MIDPREYPLMVFARLAEESKQNDPELHQLVNAVKAGDIAEVKRLLAKGLSPNQLPPSGPDTAVWEALYARKPDVMRVLAEAGADLDAGYPNTPLEVASEWGHVELIRALIEGGADVNRPTLSGETPLRAALTKGHTEAALALLKGGADPTFAPACTRYPQRTTPLEYAAFVMGPPVLDAVLSALGEEQVEGLDVMLLCGAAARGDLAEIKRRLAAGADVNAPDRSRETPLYAAASHGQTGAVKTLLAAGASTRGVGAKRPLAAAAMCGKLAIVKLLVEAGLNGASSKEASSDDADSNDIEDALRYAKNCRHKKVVEYLLSVCQSMGATPAAVDRPTGVPTFDVNDSCLLAEAPVEKASAELKALWGAKTLKTNVLGKRVKLARRCYAIFRIVGQPWSIVMRLCSNVDETFHKPSDAAAVSKSLKTRVILVNSGDTGGVYQYFAYDKGKLVEVFDVGSGISLDLAGLQDIARAKQITFASSMRKPDLKRVKNPLDFIGNHLKSENALVPFGFESLGDPGETVELTLEGLGPDDVERLDYIAV